MHSQDPPAPCLALVTGAAGFIGTGLVHHLDQLGVDVISLARRPSLNPLPGRQIVLPDFSDTAALTGLLRHLKPQVVFHLAGTTVATEPAVFEADLRMTRALLRAAASVDPAPRIVLAGSAAEYGPLEPAALPAGEFTPCRPVSAYGITKLAQTRLGLAAAAEGVPVVIARLFNVIGPGMGHILLLGASSVALPP